MDSLKYNLDVLRPLIYVVSEEEDKLLDDIYLQTRSNSELYIYRTTTGILDYQTYVKEKDKKEEVIDLKTMPIHIALSEIQKRQSADKRMIFVLLDIDFQLYESQSSNAQTIRKLKDIVLNIYHDYSHLKTIVLVSPSLNIPSKLSRYCEVVFYNLPSDKEIDNKVKSFLESFNSVLDKKNAVPTKVNEIVKMAMRGLTLFEIEQVLISSLKRKKSIDFDEVNKYKKSVLRKTDMLDVLETDITFEKVAGLGRLKEWFKKRQGLWSEEAIELKIPFIKGVLILGITGCGKSLIAKAIGNLWNIPLISFSTSKIFSSRVSESESRLLSILKIIESNAPCILFIDEIEKQFAGLQSSTYSDAGTTARFISSFLTWYQDSTAPVVIVATCNDMKQMPPELISRFDDKFFVPLPSLNDRISIYDIHIKGTGRDPIALKLDLQELAEKSQFFTGREIEQVVKSALTEMWYERKSFGDVELSQKHLLQIIHSKIAVNSIMHEDLSALVQWVGWDDSKKDGIRANYACNREDDIDALFTEIMKKGSSEKKD